MIPIGSRVAISKQFDDEFLAYHYNKTNKANLEMFL